MKSKRTSARKPRVVRKSKGVASDAFDFWWAHHGRLIDPYVSDVACSIKREALSYEAYKAGYEKAMKHMREFMATKVSIDDFDVSGDGGF